MTEQTRMEMQAMTGQARELYESWRQLGHAEEQALDEVRRSGVLDEELVKWREAAGSDGLRLSVKLERDCYGRTIVTGLLIEGRPIRADDLRKIRLSDLEAVDRDEAAEQVLAELPPLRRAPGMEAEEFSRLVADHFKQWARLGPFPADAMANAYGIKPPTIHTWIREARLRGLLPAAVRGKRSPIPSPKVSP